MKCSICESGTINVSKMWKCICGEINCHHIWACQCGKDREYSGKLLRIAGIILNGKKTINTDFGKKTDLGIATTIDNILNEK